MTELAAGPGGVTSSEARDINNQGRLICFLKPAGGALAYVSEPGAGI
jgi:hypothetical protein